MLPMFGAQQASRIPICNTGDITCILQVTVQIERDQGWQTIGEVKTI